MKTLPTIAELRRKNYKVRVSHFRKTSPHSDLYPVREIRNECGDLSFVDPCGGKTIVEILNPDGKELRGEAVCSIKDNWNRKRGITIALARALADN